MGTPKAPREGRVVRGASAGERGGGGGLAGTLEAVAGAQGAAARPREVEWRPVTGQKHRPRRTDPDPVPDAIESAAIETRPQSCPGETTTLSREQNLVSA